MSKKHYLAPIKCKICRTEFKPANSRIKTCSRSCGIKLGHQNKRKGALYRKANNAVIKPSIHAGSASVKTATSPSHIQGASWKSVTGDSLSDLEAKALALWCPEDCIDRRPGRRA